MWGQPLIPPLPGKICGPSSYFTVGAKCSKPSSFGAAQLPVYSLPWSVEKREEPIQESTAWNDSTPPTSDITGPVWGAKSPAHLLGSWGWSRGEQGSLPTSPRQLEKSALQP